MPKGLTVAGEGWVRGVLSRPAAAPRVLGRLVAVVVVVVLVMQSGSAMGHWGRKLELGE